MKVIKWLIMNCSALRYIWAKIHLFSKTEHNIQHIFFRAEKTSFATAKKIKIKGRILKKMYYLCQLLRHIKITLKLSTQ